MSTYSKNYHQKVKLSLKDMTDKRIPYGTILEDGHKTKWKYVDISGVLFGRLMGVRPVGHTKRHGLLWLMRCVCGDEVIRPTAGLNKASSCGCGNLIGEKKDGHALNALYWEYKGSAERRKHQFELSILEFSLLTSGDCYYCGESPSKIKKSSHGDYMYNGVDRVNNSIGYISHNCVPCCSKCNFAKRDFSAENFINIVDSIYKNVHKFDIDLKVS